MIITQQTDQGTQTTRCARNEKYAFKIQSLDGGDYNINRVGSTDKQSDVYCSYPLIALIWTAQLNSHLTVFDIPLETILDPAYFEFTSFTRDVGAIRFSGRIVKDIELFESAETFKRDENLEVELLPNAPYFVLKATLTFPDVSITIENQFPAEQLESVRVPSRVVSTTVHKGDLTPALNYDIDPIEPCSIDREQCTLSYYGLPEYRAPGKGFSVFRLWSIVLLVGVVLVVLGTVMKKR